MLSVRPSRDFFAKFNTSIQYQSSISYMDIVISMIDIVNGFVFLRKKKKKNPSLSQESESYNHKMELQHHPPEFHLEPIY